MKKRLALLLAVVMLLCAGCNFETDEKRSSSKKDKNTDVLDIFSTEPTQTEAEPTKDSTIASTTTEPTASRPSETNPTQTTAPATEEPQKPTHSPYYISGVDTDTMLRYFSEVALDAEFINSGNATLVQKWNDSVRYLLIGAPTEEDRAAVAAMASSMNGISGFPGMYEVSDPGSANLEIHFVSEDEMINILGDNFYGCDGGVTIWWNGDQQIYKATICIRTDLDQYVRNSVIMEEIYNGLGPIQDTNLRSDSLIWSGYSTPQGMTQVDMLIMKLLYHPNIRCGMNAQQCEKVIRELYY